MSSTKVLGFSIFCLSETEIKSTSEKRLETRFSTSRKDIVNYDKALQRHSVINNIFLHED